MIFTASIFTKLAIVKINVHVYVCVCVCTELYPDRKENVQNTNKISFTPYGMDSNTLIFKKLTPLNGDLMYQTSQ